MRYVPIILFLFSCTTTKQTIATLDGSKSYDGNGGKIVTYRWEQVAGEDAIIYNPDDVVTRVSLPKIGVYVFQLLGKNDIGLTGIDTTMVRVKNTK